MAGGKITKHDIDTSVCHVDLKGENGPSAEVVSGNKVLLKAEFLRSSATLDPGPNDPLVGTGYTAEGKKALFSANTDALNPPGNQIATGLCYAHGKGVEMSGVPVVPDNVFNR